MERSVYVNIISVEAPNYNAFLTFIRDVEGLERVVRVDTINFHEMVRKHYLVKKYRTSYQQVFK